MSGEIPDKNLFMMCRALNRDALSDLPARFHTRPCRKNELDLWKAMPFDAPETAAAYHSYMTEFFNVTYAAKGDLFYEKCLFVCNEADEPVGTCFIWKAYDRINTVHWFKVLKTYEGMGIGRALFSKVMRELDAANYPVYLHTQPSSYRAIKLYADFGFELLSDPMIGSRQNDLGECLPILEKVMPQEAFLKLQFTQAPEGFLKVVHSSSSVQF